MGQINACDRENRCRKAFFVPPPAGGEAGAIVQHDLVLTGAGTDQLREPTVVWLQLMRTFAQGLVAVVPSASRE